MQSEDDGAAIAATRIDMTQYPQSPPGWYPDPTGRYRHRWFDGGDWTAAIDLANGTSGTDPAWSAPPTATWTNETSSPSRQATSTPSGARGQITGTRVPIAVGPTVAAIIGVGLVVLGGTVLPWVNTGDGYPISHWDTTLPKLLTQSSSDLFVTSRIFWRGAVFGVLGLTAMTAVAAIFRSAWRVPAALCALVTLVWQLSATTMVVFRSLADDKLHVDFQWFQDWGIGLWATTVGVIVCFVSAVLPRRHLRRSGR